jgi:hypothetical protein
MRTDKQKEASRANGAKSHGPTTPEGKAASAQNAATHGLNARNPILLTNEEQANFDSLRNAYHDELRPVGIIETGIVEEMASVQWRRQRGEAIEAALINVTMARQAPEVERCFHVCSEATKIALAVVHLGDESKSLANIQRNNLRLARHFLRLHTTLRQLQAERPVNQPPVPGPQNEIAQNEPEPAQPAPQQQDAQPVLPNPAAWLASFLRANLPADKARAAGSSDDTTMDTNNATDNLGID